MILLGKPFHCVLGIIDYDSYSEECGYYLECGNIEVNLFILYGKGFKKFEADELAAFGKAAGFEKIQVNDIVKGKSFVVINEK